MARLKNPLAETKWKDGEVIQSNPLIESNKHMNLTESRLFYLGLMELRPQLQKELPAGKKEGKFETAEFHFEPLYFKAADVIQLLGNNPNYYKKLHDITEQLSVKKISRYVKDKATGKKGWEHIPVFAKISWQSEEYSEGLMIKFNDEMKPYIYNLAGNGYTTVAGKTIFSLQSVYAIRLIEILLQYRGFAKKCDETFIIERKIAVDELRRWLDIPDNQYTLTAEFKRRVLDSSSKYIEKNTQYRLEYTSQKMGRKIVAYVFTLELPAEDYEVTNIKDITELKQKKEINITANIDNEQAAIYDVLRYYGVGKNVAVELTKEYTEERIRANIRYALSQRRVKKYGAYIPAAIRENYAATRSQFEQVTLFQQQEAAVPEAPKYTSAERKKIDAEQYAADLQRMSDNLTKPLDEQAPIRPSTIKKLVDKEKNPPGLEYELKKMGMSRDEIKALTLEELTARIEKGAAAPKKEPAPEEKPVEKIQDPEPETIPEPNIFDELEAAPEAKAAAAEQRDLLAQFSEIELEMIKYSIKFGEPLDDELRAKVDASGAKLFHIYRLLNK